MTARKPEGKSPLGHEVYSQAQLAKFTERGSKKPLKFAVPVPGTGNDFETGMNSRVNISALPFSSPTGEIAQLFSKCSSKFIIPTGQTLYDAFEAGLHENPDGPCLGYRPTIKDQATGMLISQDYVWQSYKTVSSRRLEFGSGLLHIWTNILKREVHQKFFVGLYSVNRVEWLISDLGCHAFGLGTVALYDTLGPETVEFVINHSELPIIVTSLDKVANVLKVAEKCPKLKVIISMDSFKQQGASSMSIPPSFAVLQEWAQQRGIYLVDYGFVESLGKKNPRKPRPPQADDIATICYTSGTTGLPKGAMLTHGGLISVARGAEFVGMDLDKNDSHISYLPLAHVYERCVVVQILLKGGRIGVFRGDVAVLIEDIGQLKPTVFASVPRLLNRIHDKIVAATLNSGSKVKAMLFQKAFESKMESLNSTGSLEHFFWDSLVFKKIQALLGGKVRIIMSASAPISSDVMSFLRVVFGCHVLEAYGQTETNGALSVTWKGDLDKGHVGPPLPSCEVKLVSVPEMNYKVTDKPNPRGEICVRGPIVFKGYLKDVEKTREALKPDGWLHTGDIGYIDERGRIFIIDRKKNIFKLSQGEYVAPEKIENTYIKSQFVAQIYVHGDSLRNELVAVIVPDIEVCIPFAKEQKLLGPSVPNPVGPQQPGQPLPSEYVELCNNPQFKRFVLQDMNRIGAEAKLRGFEFVKNIYISPELFSVANGLLTPTFKVKRNEAKVLYGY